MAVSDCLVAEGMMLRPRQKVRLCRELRSVSRHYWADRDHDNRVPKATVRNEIASVSERLAQLQSAVATLSAQARQQLTAEIMKRKTGERPSSLNDFEEQLRKLKAAADPFAQVRGTNVALTCVANASSKLWDLREELTGRPFGRQWKPERGMGDRKSLAAHPDAYFVEIALQAIDPVVTAQQISTGFKKRVAQEKTRSKQSQKTGDDLS